MAISATLLAPDGKNVEDLKLWLFLQELRVFMIIPILGVASILRLNEKREYSERVERNLLEFPWISSAFK